MPELQCRVSPEHRPGPEPDCVHGEKAGPESDSPALAETRMGLWLAMGSSLSSVGGRRKQKSALSRSGKSAGAGHWAGGGTRRVHEESVRAGGDWNRCGGTPCTRKSAAQPQCGQIGSERGVGAGAGAAG
jgi:hypothetical protein